MDLRHCAQIYIGSLGGNDSVHFVCFGCCSKKFVLTILLLCGLQLEFVAILAPHSHSHRFNCVDLSHKRLFQLFRAGAVISYERYSGTSRKIVPSAVAMFFFEERLSFLSFCVIFREL